MRNELVNTSTLDGGAGFALAIEGGFAFIVKVNFNLDA
jgi:hypothetical protein